MNPNVEELDVNIAFLLGTLEEEIHIEHAEGFKVKYKKDFVCVSLKI